IQQYLLPNLSEAMKGIAETFVIWKPRDVVSGDFYWHRKIGNKNLLALADCTGHGVSGALLTVICMDTLNRCVDEHGLTDPADILNKCQNMLSLSWRQGGAKGMSDGMDICLCCFEEERLSFASASTPLYLFRNGTLTEHRGDRLSIGTGTYSDHQFSSKEIILNEMDRLYMLTDGVVDQFGGSADRKFGKPRIRTLISEVGNRSFSEQRQIFHRTFENWRGTRAQVDDKTFLAIEIHGKPA
ncbi:MAG: SpoIIE family protein phosphatase, partial [Flavobacteriales bacterium]|nr:SpoIIE family protein phosphatase [Flavobacteriales bacterium]